MLKTDLPNFRGPRSRSLRSFIAVFFAAVASAFSQTESKPENPAPPAPPAPAAPPAEEKRVVVDKAEQTLTAYEGERVVIQTKVSTGRSGWRTPSGEFRVGIKERMHYSRLFDNAPMPWSVQVNGHIFIHGFSYVPDFPASHGCIRVPTSGDNPAKRFFEWVEPGTPVSVTGEWVPIPKARVVRKPKAN